MLVKNLIKELEKYNPNAEITLPTHEDIMLSYISENNATPKTTQIVFIEGCDVCGSCCYYELGYCSFHKWDCVGIDECDIIMD